jgi:hypothetical protein
MKQDQVTKMIAAHSAKTEMVEKKVKIEALQPLFIHDRHVAVGERVELTEDEAAGFLKPYTKLKFAFSGERMDEDAHRHKIVRAKLVE